ncbi:LysE family translocator [Endozoicomonas sp. Mp262]|uniref:LysE family translocator n=1 Tax=Endozoicomonas sp. Mp262 TaxID=2919499 RepID=UPI0021DA69BF
MVDLSVLVLFIPTFFLVSVTPGMCMMLAMTMGMTIGIRQTLWMMLGELTGVALVAVSAVIGIAAVMLAYPSVFTVLKWLGGCYLVFLGIQMWLSRGRMSIPQGQEKSQAVSAKELAVQGFVTAVVNPKGWAFFIALLPPFIRADYALVPQLVVLISLILLLESICLLIYASGGKTLGYLLQKSSHVRVMNRVAGSLMLLVGLWLILG